MMRYLLAICLLIPHSVFANEFYVYGAFDGVVSGFTRIATIFNDSQYSLLLYVVVFIGIMAGTLIATGKGFMGSGKGSNALAALFVPLLGVALFKAMMIPTTTMHIYDPIGNRYQSVGNVPSLIGNIAEAVNALERFTTDTLSTGGTPREQHANGITLQLALNYMYGDPFAEDEWTKKNINQFISRCMPIALTSSNYTFNLETLMNNSFDIWDYLENIKSSTVTTYHYSSSNKSGVPVSCATMYDNLEAVLVTTTTTFDKYIEKTCKKSGFPISSAAQLATCKARLSSITKEIFGDASNTPSAAGIGASVAIANELYNVYADQKGSAIAIAGNTRQVSEGLGSLIVTEGWLPTMRYNVTLLIISLTPFFALMFVTPMLFKSLHLMLTLFIFTAMWGLIDAMMHDIIFGQIIDMLYSLKSSKMGIWTILTAPNELQKSLALLGKQQSMGVTLALALSVMFFKFSGSAFARMGEKLQTDIDKIGGDTGNQVLDPSNNMGRMEAYAGAQHKHDVHAQIGSQRYNDVTGYNATSSARTTDNYMGQMVQAGYNARQLMEMPSQVRGGELSGNTQATATRADINGQQIGSYSDTNAFVDQTKQLAGTEIDLQNTQRRVISEDGTVGVSAPGTNEVLSERLSGDVAIARSHDTAKKEIFNQMGGADSAKATDGVKILENIGGTQATTKMANEQYNGDITKMSSAHSEQSIRGQEAEKRKTDKIEDMGVFKNRQAVVDAQNGNASLVVNKEQANALRNDHGINMTEDGTVNIAMDTDGNIVSSSAHDDNSASTNNSSKLDNSTSVDNQRRFAVGQYNQGNVFKHLLETGQRDTLMNMVLQSVSNKETDQLYSQIANEYLAKDELQNSQQNTDNMDISASASLSANKELLGTEPSGKQELSASDKLKQKQGKSLSSKANRKGAIDNVAEQFGISANLGLKGNVGYTKQDSDAGYRNQSIDYRTQRFKMLEMEMEQQGLNDKEKAEKIVDLIENVMSFDDELTRKEVDYDVNPLGEIAESTLNGLSSLGISEEALNNTEDALNLIGIQPHRKISID